jgi:hypothetical protein
MNFNAYIQGKLYKAITATSVLAALAQVAADIKAGLVTGYDSSKPENITLDNIS